MCLFPKMKFLIVFLLFTSISQTSCFADTTIQTARKSLAIKNGDILPYDSFWEGTIENIENVTFVGWNFSRKIPHTQVFINCKDLTFIDCNLNNVELQADFKVNGSLTIHQQDYSLLGKLYKEVECGDNKTRTYEIVTETKDLIEEKFPTFNKDDKDKIREEYEAEGIKTIYTIENQVLVNEVETPDEKKIKAIRIK